MAHLAPLITPHLHHWLRTMAGTDAAGKAAVLADLQAIAAKGAKNQAHTAALQAFCGHAAVLVEALHVVASCESPVVCPTCQQPVFDGTFPGLSCKACVAALASKPDFAPVEIPVAPSAGVVFAKAISDKYGQQYIGLAGPAPASLTFPTKEAQITWVRHELKVSDVFALKGLLIVYANQTYAEQIAETVEEDNGVGFTGIDGRILCSFSKAVLRWNSEKQPKYITPLSAKQMAFLHKLITKYAAQVIKFSTDGSIPAVVHVSKQKAGAA